MKIRNAALSDAAIIADFNIRLAQETENLQLAPPVITAGVTAVLTDAGKGMYFVAEVAGEIVGQMMVTYEWSDWRNGNIWWIQSVYVKPEFRGNGIFQALFAHVEQLARGSKNVCRLRLYFEKHNERARRAYLKLGMDETAYQVMEFNVEKN